MGANLAVATAKPTEKALHGVRLTGDGFVVNRELDEAGRKLMVRFPSPHLDTPPPQTYNPLNPW
jgi:hypothetical protein